MQKCIKVLRELYSNFTTGISPFCKNNIIDVKRGVRQGGTISPKILTTTLEDAMRKLEWDDMGVKIDGYAICALLMTSKAFFKSKKVRERNLVLS
ncbi:hypothetical protein RB195_015188 [Necator americanus]|uniref:Reverse transcriptase domain-containing protein n=1 Tax=Necator americanus TaxID=51031 RepID=A0ABR1E3D9_NECAM